MFNTNFEPFLNPFFLEPDFSNTMNPSLQAPEEEQDMALKHMIWTGLRSCHS